MNPLVITNDERVDKVINQLVQPMRQKILVGELQLSSDEWRDFNDILADLQPSALDEAADLVITAFQANEKLADSFAKELAELTAGTILTGRELQPATNAPELTKNERTFLEFKKEAEEQAKTAQKK